MVSTAAVVAAVPVSVSVSVSVAVSVAVAVAVSVSVVGIPGRLIGGNSRLNRVVLMLIRRLRGLDRAGGERDGRVVLTRAVRLDLPGEVAARQILRHGLHVLDPHVHRPVAAMEMVEATNVVQGHRVTEFIRLVHGHGRDHAGYETNELRGQLVGGRTGLAGGHQAINRRVNIVRGTVALRDSLEGRHDGRHLFDIEHADWIHVAAEEQLVAGILDLLDNVCADALAAVRDRRVSGRQVDVVRGR